VATAHPAPEARPSSNVNDDPLWYKDAVIYQLHVKSFFDSDNDGVGDFPGLISKLDYIAELGVTTIWLLPFYPSPRRDDGYDISEYRDVHPEYGKLDDVRRLISEAHARGIRVITELVINHTSDAHPWFQAARAAPVGSAERDFYVWSDDDKRWADTRIIFLDTEKSNWTWDPVAKAYFWHRFYSHQPDLNFDNPAVLAEVLAVMKFWLEAGVDGLRLDAIPYLVERDGTSNENLPETHQVLKRIRAELDATYPDRMLLAEANMWPEDTQQYFGDGDECHMAFHFPLMPRIYMAIAQEDRFPITDIMRQTPAIPSSCQWAIFLRNHDELTLEMVTDQERDYLWETYAADRRARINLGIRRRLAPLMQRDRRRVELMNFLLLTMPGTPVLYYGDEIGMGDNIHLGDRDGVRTPMQWSSDRNGGFSRADPAELTLPAIMDPLYGFQAINVEAQVRDSHSLLNTLRRLLAVRQQHQAFGRGAQRFLRPHNRKVLAYLREYEGETILCVANMSRTAQAVELELSEFAGRTPLELTGRTAFPTIGQLTYLLTLQPYGFYWFQLCEGVAAPAWSTATAGAPEYHTFVLRGNLPDLMEPQSRSILEQEILPAYVAARRWFQSKDAGAHRVVASRWLRLPGSGDQFALQLEVATADGSAAYQLPLAVAWEDEPAGPFAHNLALARVRRGRRVGLLTDAFATPGFIRGLLQGFMSGEGLDETGPALSYRLEPGVRLSLDAPLEWLAAEQSNSSVRIGADAVLKLLRRTEAGVHPEAEMTRELGARGFLNVAPLLGEVVWLDEQGVPSTVVVLQGFIENQGDGWSWTSGYLGRLLQDHGETTGHGEADLGFENYESFAGVLGRRVAAMHATLGLPSDNPAFAPEAADAAQLARWEARVGSQIGAALDMLQGQKRRLADTGQVEALIANRDRLLAAVARLAQGALGAACTRIHGDLHLGQVLVTAGDVVIVDFEGEPLRTLEQRREKDSRWRDVAGMLRSFDYAAAMAASDTDLRRTEAGEARADELVDRFRQAAVDAFLAGYAQEGLAEDTGLLDLFLLEKAAYEVMYEAANRPDWLYVPARGLCAVAERLLAGAAQ
jgi:maltose alpha-D-glucosyltransferase/alpha-amylase